MAKNNTDKIKHRMPYGAPSVKHYDISSIIRKSDKFEVIIDKRIIQLKKQGIDIDACPEYLESLAEEYIATLFSALERKHRTTKNLIQNMFIRRAADKLELSRLIEVFEEQIASTEEEFNLVERLYKNFNPLYKGRLKLQSEKVEIDETDGGEDEDDE